MGLQITDSLPARARPFTEVEYEPYDFREKRAAWLVTRRPPHLQGGWVKQRIMQALYFLLGFETNAPFDIMCIATTEEQADAFCTDEHFRIGLIPVGECLPVEPIGWNNWSPRSWFKLGKPVPEAKTYSLVATKDLEALRREVARLSRGDLTAPLSHPLTDSPSRWEGGASPRPQCEEEASSRDQSDHGADGSDRRGGEEDDS